MLTEQPIKIVRARRIGVYHLPAQSEAMLIVQEQLAKNAHRKSEFAERLGVVAVRDRLRDNGKT